LFFVWYLFARYLLDICLTICGCFVRKPCVHLELCGQVELEIESLNNIAVVGVPTLSRHRHNERLARLEVPSAA
jgi:hypothetical protein